MKFKWEREHTRKVRAAARAEARRIRKELRTTDWKKEKTNESTN